MKTAQLMLRNSAFLMFFRRSSVGFLGFQSNPDLILKGITHNIIMTGEFIVNLVDQGIADQIVACAASVTRGENETGPAGLTLT